jgi:hypothetical protein
MRQFDTTVLECGCLNSVEVSPTSAGTVSVKLHRSEICPLHAATSALLASLSASTWLVWSNEHCAWWGPNRRNYYMSIESAGRYSLEEAMRICRFRSQEPNANPTELIQPSPEWIEARKIAITKAAGEAI